MKKPKFFLALLISLATLQICAGQQKPALEMVSKIDNFECELLMANLDNFMVMLRNEPDTVGYMIYRYGADSIKSNFYEHMLKNHFKFRRFPGERIRFIGAKPAQDFQAELWISRDGTKPAVEAAGADELTLKPVKNRYLLADDVVEVVKSEGKLIYQTYSECDPQSVSFYRLAEILNARPDLTAEVFVYHKKRSRAAQLIKIFTDEATREYKILPARLKSSYAGVDKEAEGKYIDTISTVKIWLVPSGEKK